MDKIYKILIIFEMILLLIFLIGYFFYDDLHRIDEQISCEIKNFSIDFGNIAIRNINGEDIGLLSDKKEDLNS